MTSDSPLSCSSLPVEPTVAPPPWEWALVAALQGVLVLGLLAQLLTRQSGMLAQVWLRGLVVPLGGTGAAVAVLGWRNWSGLVRRLELSLPAAACPQGLWAGCQGGVGAFAVAIPLVALSQWVLAPILPTPPPALTDLLAAHLTRGMWVTVFIQALVLAPLAEELLFRLCMVEAFRLHGLPRPGLLMALLFAAIHGRPEQVAGLCVLALWLYRLRCRYASLLPAILAHAVFNALVLAAASWQLLKG